MPQASRSFVEKFIIDDEADFNSVHPSVVLARFLEPFIEFGKLTVVEVSARDNNTIDIAASLVERVVGQSAP